jgi:glycosyltransferase involved in cell wall biosynthesis
VREKLRILHCPLAIGGGPPGLARAERALGMDSIAVAYGGGPYAYECDELLWQPGDGFFSRELKRWRLYRRALRDFDVVHFNFGSSILTWGGLFQGRERLSLRDRMLLPLAPHLELRDLPALRRAGKVIAVTYQGDDARQGDVAGRFPISLPREVEPGYYSAVSDARKRERIARFARYAHLVYAYNPDLLRVLPAGARFLPYPHIDLDAWRPGEASANARPLVIHAPSHRRVKGTQYLLDAVERLRARGAAFDFQLVENMTHKDAAALYRKADIVVDQLIAGWYGGFGLEAMALGKPLVAYVREEDLGFIPPGMRAELPVVNATPSSVETVLAGLVAKPAAELRALGAASRRFVERWHDPLTLARGLVDDYRKAALPCAA